MDKFILVVGVPSGGTSCLAGVLQRLGVFMGARQMGAWGRRRYHTYEDLDILELIEIPWKTNPDRLGRELLGIVKTRLAEDHPRVGGKQPWMVRLCKCSPEVLEECKRSIDLVVVERPMGEVLRSANTYEVEPRRKIPRSRALRAWGNMLEELRSRWTPRGAVVYNDLVDNTHETIGELIRELGLQPTPKQVSEAEAFVRPEMRHVGS